MGQHVVLLEAGGKQEFVFASNKQAVNVGGSELIRAMGEDWVRDAMRSVAPGRSVEEWELVISSGKAVLVVPDRATGREIVRVITRRALREAPGLGVCGVVVPVAGSLGDTVAEAHREHGRVRARLASARLRQPTLPYVQPCHYSALPATALGDEGGQSFPRAMSVDAAWRQGGVGRRRMVKYLTDEAVLSAGRLDQGVENAGWIAVVHADGNGIGALFGALPGAYSDNEDYRRAYGGLSKALDDVTKTALRAAVIKQDRADWILPIVVSGDDVTAVMDARPAFDTTRTFLEQFEAASQIPAIMSVLQRVRGTGEGPDGLTASAGIAFVKPHHPFSDAYRLAEELCESAKALKGVDGGHSAIDFHVLHDPVGRPLRALRSEQVGQDSDGVPLRRWGGPYLVGGSTQDDARPIRHVDYLVAALLDQRGGESGPALPVGAVLRLREALVVGGARIDRERDQVVSWSDPAGGAQRASEFLAAHLRQTPDLLTNVDDLVNMRFTRLIDALHLLDMERGTTAAGMRT